MVRLVLAVSMLALGGCGSRLDETFVEGLRRLTGTVSSGRNGAAKVKVDVADGEVALLVTGITGEPLRTNIRGVESPETLVFDAFDQDENFSKTNGGYVAGVASLNWPVAASDPGLGEGRWALLLGVVDEANEWAAGQIAVDVLLKEDDALDAGAVHATIVFADGVGDDPGVVAAAEAAVEVWADLYDQLDLELTWEFLTWEQGPLEPPGLGSPEAWEELSAMTRLRTVRVVLAPAIVGYDDVYGIAGDIPGPLVISARSGVLVSTLLAAGADGGFSKEDERLLGETLAHEAGHYLGLFHPVEVTYQSWDVLADTTECSAESECIQALGRNLMFPFPVCGIVSCTPQDQLTMDQGGVVHRHVAVE